MKNRKRLKIALSLILIFTMLFVSMPVTVLAAEDVCKIGDTGYTTLKKAMQAANDGDVIDVIRNTNMTSRYTVTKKIEITSSNKSRVAVTCNKGFTIGNGTAENSTAGELTLSGNLQIVTNKEVVTAMFMLQSGTLTVKDNVYCESQTSYVVDSDGSGDAPIYINIHGGTLKSVSKLNEKATIYVGGTGSVVNMTGGTVIQGSNNSFAFKIDSQNSNVNISGGHVKAVRNTLASHTADVGKVINITGGIVEAEEDSTIYTFYKCDYLTVNISDNALLTAKRNTVRLESPMSTVNIKGGTVIATEDAPISMGWGTLNISGGKIILDSNKSATYVVRSAFNKNKNFPAFINISGGLFINKNENNKTVMTDSINGTTPISFTGGKVLYKDNVDYVLDDKTVAPKTAEAIYEGETYYIFNRFSSTNAKDTGIMGDGATIRLTEGDEGLRFSASFSEKVVSSLEKKGDVSYGMLIIPTNQLTNLKEFTIESLNAKYGEGNYLNVVCTEGTGAEKLPNGNLRLQAAITNIKADNYNTAFSAVAYACVNGSYYYAAYDQSICSATISDIAKAALADTSADYTDAQKAILNGFAG